MRRQFVLRLRCQELDSSSISGDFNPQIIVSEQSDAQWVERGRTEVAFKTKNPQFSHPIQINYEFQESFKVKFDVFCCQGEQKHPIGSTQANITALLAAKDQIYYTDLQNKRQKQVGRIIIIGEYQIYKNDLVEMEISFNHLEKGKFMCCIQRPTNPIIKIFRVVQDSKEKSFVYESQSINYKGSKKWPTIKKYSKELCNHDHDTALQFEIYDKNNNQQIYIGQVSASLNQLRGSYSKRNIQNGGIVTGSINFENCSIIEVPTFEQYIQGGLQLNLMISIDFTDSNLEVTNPQSLHYFDTSGRKLSQYETALRYISEILIQYDHDKSVPLYGFGFENQNQNTQHCYPLNHNYEDAEVQGLIGIFQTYREFVKTIKFAGPTLFRPTLNTAKKMAKGFKDSGSEKYIVLTILTDGLISDFEGSFEMIVDCCELPISIIIIGIGDADFTLMERLNNDDLQEEDSQGRKATRDLVKFVAFNNFQKDPKRLAREVLSELPDQVVNYMQMIGKKPGNSQNIAGRLPDMRQSAQLQELQKYYQPGKLKRQNTLQKYLGEEPDQEEDERTLITKHPIMPQFQQQQQQQIHNIPNPFADESQIQLQDIKLLQNRIFQQDQQQKPFESVLIQPPQQQIQQQNLSDEQKQQLQQNNSLNSAQSNPQIQSIPINPNQPINLVQIQKNSNQINQINGDSSLKSDYFNQSLFQNHQKNNPFNPVN